MFGRNSRRALVCVAVLAFAAGCSGNPASPVANASSPTVPSARQIPPGMRALPGPDILGPTVVPLVPRPVNAPRGWPARKKRKPEILFIADASSGVLMFNPRKAGSAPIGSITTGVNGPNGLAVDKSGSLYVANGGNNTVSVYPKGQSAPSLTISSGISSPYGIGVDSSGEVFVSNLGTNAVTGYKSGATSPFETISFNAFGQAVGVGIDGSNNIWVACDTTNSVYEIPAGSSTPMNSGFADVSGPIGISFGHHNVTYVSDISASTVEIYQYGTTTPSGSLTSGIEHYGPTLNGFTHSGAFFQSNQFDNVVGYKRKGTSPYSTLSVSSPLGVASEPLIKK